VSMTSPSAGPGGARPGPRRRPGEFGGGGGGGGGRKFTPRRKVCQFCVDKIKEVDYKDLGRLRRFLSDRAKIEPRRKTGTCAAHQRSLNVALKRARQLALLPFTAEHIRITGMLLREPGTPPWRGTRGPPRPVEAPEAVVAAAPDGVATVTDGVATAPTDGSPAPTAPAAPAADAGEAAAPTPTPAPVAEASAVAEVPVAAATVEG
jgi:small subunit ribosomal protein S18